MYLCQWWWSVDNINHTNLYLYLHNILHTFHINALHLYDYTLFYVAKTATAVISNSVLYATITIDILLYNNEIIWLPYKCEPSDFIACPRAALQLVIAYIRSSFIAFGAPIVYDMIVEHGYNVLCIWDFFEILYELI